MPFWRREPRATQDDSRPGHTNCANACELMAIMTLARYRLHKALYDRSPTARCTFSSDRDLIMQETVTHIEQDGIANLLVLELNVLMVERFALKVGNDGQTLNLSILVNQESGEISDRKRELEMAPTEGTPEQ